MQALLMRYMDAWKNFTPPHGEMMPAGLSLLDAYNAPARPYHNITHLRDVLDKLDWAKFAVAEEPEVQAMDDAQRARMFAHIELALFYHDVIYDAKAKDNEARSSALFREHSALFGMAPDDAQTVSRLIDITAKHTQAFTIDEKILTDCDLAILGAPRAEFDAYDRNIRREYAHVPAALYKIARAQVLAHFRDAPQLYKTAAFRRKFDAAARANLARATAPQPVAQKILRLFKR